MPSIGFLGNNDELTYLYKFANLQSLLVDCRSVRGVRNGRPTTYNPNNVDPY